MKKVIYLLLIGGAIFICPHQSKAEPYYLARSFNHHHQSIHIFSPIPPNDYCQSESEYSETFDASIANVEINVSFSKSFPSKILYATSALFCPTVNGDWAAVHFQIPSAPSFFIAAFASGPPFAL